MAEDKKKLSLEDLASKLSDIKDKVKQKHKFNIRDIHHKDNKPGAAVKAYHYIQTEGADEISTLETDIQDLYSEGFSSMLRQFRVDKKLKTYNLRGKESDEALELARELLGKVLGHSLETYYSLYDGKEKWKDLIEGLKSGKFDADAAQNALQIVHRGSDRGAPDFDTLVKQFADYLTTRGSSFKDISKEALQRFYTPMMSFATSHIDQVRYMPKKYLMLRHDEEDALEKVAKHLIKQIPKPEKGSIDLKKSTKGNMAQMLGILDLGYDEGFGSKKQFGPTIDKLLKYKDGAKYEHIIK